MLKNLFFSILLSTSTSVFAANSFQKSCDINENLYIGQYSENLQRHFGSPDFKDSFQIKDVVGEFRIELLNIYPPSNPENLKVRVWEWTWNTGDCRTTVWFHMEGGYKKSILARGWHKNEEQ